jgi:ABC-type multidrug transport system fused ATPase/permease subunit
MDHGRIVDMGRYDDLVERNSILADLSRASQ